MEGSKMSSGGGSFVPSSVTGTGGNAFSNVYGTAGGFLGGTVAGLTGATAVADATGQAANAQLGQQTADRQQALGYAMPTQAEMQQLQQAMAVNQQGISQGQQLINSANPALISAAQQANSLLNGGSAASLAPIQNQRATQRSSLTQQLQQQLGSGYATSSAGIQALNNFDQQTANLMTNAQQSTLQGLLGTTQQTYSTGATQQQQGFSNSLAGNQQQYGWQQGQIGALQGTPVNPGLQYSGQLANAQANSNLGLGGVAGLVGTAAGAYKTFGGGASAAGAA